MLIENYNYNRLLWFSIIIKNFFQKLKKIINKLMLIIHYNYH